jgi:hypothetical protein
MTRIQLLILLLIVLLCALLATASQPGAAPAVGLSAQCWAPLT